MKHYKPGQFVSIGDGFIYMAVKRECGCVGCLFKNDLFLCPGIAAKNTEPTINCSADGIILQRCM